MCGIAGLLDYKGGVSKKKALLLKALNSIRYRGPDDLNYLTSDNFFCGGTVRLSIEALSSGRQPISDGRFTIGFNGEIFNYQFLISKYKLNSFNIDSEISFLLHAWKLKGEEIFKDLEGQFAIFIYDSQEQILTLVRDPFGIRPLFYTLSNDQVSFCSEVKGIFKLQNKNFPYDDVGIAQIAAFWTTVGNRTVFDGVHQVKRGHIATIKNGEVLQRSYWKEPLFTERDLNFLNESDLIDFFKTNIKNSVSQQIHGEVGHASYLSGGIDSSALAYFLKNEKKSEPLQAFSIAFENKEYDESYAQKEMADFLGINCQSLLIRNKDISLNFSLALNHAETILFRTAPIPLYLLSKKVNKFGHKVVFSGEGADEILLGYDLFAENRIRRFWSRQENSIYRPALLSRLYSYLPQFKNSRYFSIIKDFYRLNLNESDNVFYSHLVRWAQFKQVSTFFNFKKNLEFLEEKILAELLDTLPVEFKDGSPDRRAQMIEFETLLQGYLLSSQGDRMSMANSIEGRYPFLGQTFVKNMARIKDNQKTKGIKSKSLFRTAMKDLLPASISQRPKVAYQAPEAKCFLSHKHKTPEAELLTKKAVSIDILNHKNLSNLELKISNEYSSERLGFRENMSYMMCLSTAHLNELKKKWK